MRLLHSKKKNVRFIMRFRVAISQLVLLPLQDTWQEMEKLVDDGLVKSIGISNFSCKKMDDLLSYARIQPAANQVEVHPYFRNQKLMDHAKAKV